MEQTEESTKEIINKNIDKILDFFLGKNRESNKYYNTYCSCSGGKEFDLVILDNFFRLAASGMGAGLLVYLFCSLINIGGLGDILFLRCLVVGIIFAFVLAILEYIRN